MKKFFTTVGMSTTEVAQETVTTVHDLLEALGGAAHVRHRLGVAKSNTTNWRKQGRIPARHYRSICLLRDERAARDGVVISFPDELFSFDDLARPAPDDDGGDGQVAAE